MKRWHRHFLLAVILTANAVLLSSCWNYEEIDKLALVAGVAIDKHPEKSGYLMTVEIVDMKLAGKETSYDSRKIDIHGESIFDAVRNMIKISAKRLYWGHMKIIIISQEVAKEGIVEVLDFFMRDHEVRIETFVLISKETTAREILYQESVSSKIRSFEMNTMLMSQKKNLEKVPVIELYKLINTLESEGVSAILPTVGKMESGGNESSELSGVAAFKGEKLVGFLDCEDTKYLLYVLDDIKGGLIIVDEKYKDKDVCITLEVTGSKTNIEPVYKDGDLSININVRTEVIIDELNTHAELYTFKDGFAENGYENLKKNAEKTIEENIMNVVKKAQKELETDILKFGRHIKMRIPKLWKQIADDWQTIFPALKVNVKSTVVIKGSGVIRKPIIVKE